MKRPTLPLNAKRTLLIVDDEEINRDLLTVYLEEEYAIEYAVDGVDALEKLAHNPQRFSAVLLDILMPRKDGLSVLKELSQRADTKDIPVLMLTSESHLEIEALRLGALDFIKKPYESPEIVKARVWRIVEWYENTKLVNRTLFDSATGLFTKEYFRYFVSMLLEEGETVDLLAILIPKIDVAHEFFSSDLIKESMQGISSAILDFGETHEGLATYDHEGLFYVCMPRDTDVEPLAEKLQKEIDLAFPSAGLQVKFGLYPCLGKDVELACTRASRAATLVVNESRTIGYYDEKAHQLTLRRQRLLSDFLPCLKRGDFQVYFQPKYAIQGDKYTLAGAEALIRWFHKELGFISPGEFVPLLERSGRVFELDRFVYAETARVLELLHSQGRDNIAISANASRAEILDADFIPTLFSLFEGREHIKKTLHIEVTESALAESFQGIIDVVKQIHDAGIAIELDDFGSGYSSLGMLTSIPFDYLKIDMAFIRNMFASANDKAVLCAIIDMAKTLGKTTVAEGTEDEKQVVELKKLGCDLVQGYYFSKPLPEKEFFELVAKEYPNGHC